MNFQIKSIRLSNFKGIKDATYKFGNKTNISGVNGAGKSTIATAYYWVLSDRSVELASNPPVKPLDVEECTPRVDIIADIDGKEVQIAKEQKIKVKEDKNTGVKKVSSTNTYEVNAVEKTERDFKAYLSEIGIDFDKFLFLSHPDVFTAGMNEKKAREQMRNTLFAMGTEHTDLEIAKNSTETVDVAALLEKGYKAEEIEAMQNATIRKIKENYGKNGELLRAKIEGLETAKVDIDTAEIELGKKSVIEKIDEIHKKQNDITAQYEQFQKLSASVIELKAKQGDLQRVANADLVSQKNELEMKKATLEHEIRNTENELKMNSNRIEDNKKLIAQKNEEIQKLRNDLKAAKERKFDEGSTVCPYCGQEFPQEKKEKIKADFEQHKLDELTNITKNGTALKSFIEGVTTGNSKLQIDNAELEKNLNVLKNDYKKLVEYYNSLPASIDASENEDYKALQKQIDDVQAIVSKGFDANDERLALQRERDELNQQLLGFEKELAKAEQNIKIDEQIAELLSKQKEFEQSKADAEKILDQLKQFNKNKNELLSNDINSHFEIVDFKLFDYLKNGEIKDVCIPMIDGKTFGESTNTGRDVLAKLDIIKGLQNFYGQAYPVFLDGAECLSNETKERINMECQMIYLNVSEEKLKVDVNE